MKRAVTGTCARQFPQHTGHYREYSRGELPTIRKIIEAQCRTWARDQARAEYAPQIQVAARHQSYFVRSGNSAGAGLAGSTMALAQLAQHSRAQELTEACVVDRQSREAQ